MLYKKQDIKLRREEGLTDIQIMIEEAVTNGRGYDRSGFAVLDLDVFKKDFLTKGRKEGQSDIDLMLGYERTPTELQEVLRYYDTVDGKIEL